jgi:rubrerythrin
MKKMTEENLRSAFSLESQAHMKYATFAEKAEKENLPNMARLFKANSFAEQIHATNHLRILPGIGRTLENLQAAIEGETFEVEEMYPAHLSIAQEQKEPGAETTIRWALAAEKVYLHLYQRAKEAAGRGRDIDIERIHVCQICGFTVDGEAPYICPICGSPREKFIKF